MTLSLTGKISIKLFKGIIYWLKIQHVDLCYKFYPKHFHWFVLFASFVNLALWKQNDLKARCSKWFSKFTEVVEMNKIKEKTNKSRSKKIEAFRNSPQTLNKVSKWRHCLKLGEKVTIEKNRNRIHVQIVQPISSIWRAPDLFSKGSLVRSLGEALFLRDRWSQALSLMISCLSLLIQ